MTLTLTLREQPDVPLEADVLTPDRLADADDVAALPVWHGNERTRVGEFFAVSGAGDDVRLEGDLSQVKFVGAGMTAGRLTVAGDVGMHAGAGMRGGELYVEGDAGDWAGAGMRGGMLVVRGSAGSQLGGVYPGDRAGMGGGRGPAGGAARSSLWRRRPRLRLSCSPAATARRSCACTCAGCAPSGWPSPMRRSTVATRAGAATASSC